MNISSRRGEYFSSRILILLVNSFRSILEIYCKIDSIKNYSIQKINIVWSRFTDGALSLNHLCKSRNRNNVLVLGPTTDWYQIRWELFFIPNLPFVCIFRSRKFRMQVVKLSIGIFLQQLADRTRTNRRPLQAFTSWMSFTTQLSYDAMKSQIALKSSNCAFSIFLTQFYLWISFEIDVPNR